MISAPPALRRAAFLDRDGVINVDHGYVGQVERFELVSGATEGLRLLADAGFILVVVTNQSGIGRGLYAVTDFETVTRHMRAELETMGVRIALVAFCPHLPDEGCLCRKPRPGMILDAAALLDLDIAASVMIGDKASDMTAGRAAGVGRCFLVGAGEDAAVDADERFPDLLACAHAVVESGAEMRSAGHGSRSPTAASREAGEAEDGAA